jgi:hypothetical protein
VEQSNFHDLLFIVPLEPPPIQNAKQVRRYSKRV